MKFKIWNEPELVDQEKTVTLKLVVENGIAKLMAVDENGHNLSYLIVFQEDGSMYRLCCLSPGLGFPLDLQGRIKEAI